jgi:hypothetical protein
MTFIGVSTTCKQARRTLADKIGTSAIAHSRSSRHVPYADAAIIERRYHVLTSRSATRQNTNPGSFSQFSPVVATLIGQIDPIYVHVGMPVDVFLEVV